MFQSIFRRLGNLLFAVAIVLIFCLGQWFLAAPDNEPAESPDVLLTSPMADNITGFGGRVPSRIKLNPDDGTIAAIEYLPNNEDKDYWSVVVEADLIRKYIGKTPREAIELPIDAVTGATLSSRALQESIRKRLMAASDYVPTGTNSISLGWSDILVIVVLLGNVVTFFLKNSARWRLVQNIINTIVLGFVGYTYLSLALMVGWINSAPHWRWGSLLALFCVTVVLALWRGRNIYCTQICPYGCAQELAAKLGRKIDAPLIKADFKYGIYIRRILLAAAIAAVLFGVKFFPPEPFGAFAFNVPWWVYVLAGGFLVAAVFKPRLWCRWFCGCGAALDFFVRTESNIKTIKGDRKMSYERWVILVLLLIVVIALLRPQSSGMATMSPTVDAESADVLKIIHQRKSVREYTADPVSLEQLHTLVKAGFAAPSAGNLQPWEFIIVTERKKLDAMADVLEFGKMLKHAPAAIVVCGNGNEFKPARVSDMWPQDCSAATQNILLAAEGLGLGAVWLGVYPIEKRVENIARIMKLDKEVVPFCVISIGHPTGVEKPKDKYKPAKIHFQEWDKPFEVK